MGSIYIHADQMEAFHRAFDCDGQPYGAVDIKATGSGTKPLMLTLLVGSPGIAKAYAEAINAVTVDIIAKPKIEAEAV